MASTVSQSGMLWRRLWYCWLATRLFMVSAKWCCTSGMPQNSRTCVMLLTPSISLKSSGTLAHGTLPLLIITVQSSETFSMGGMPWV